MIAGFGGAFRKYRLAAALNWLRDMPEGTRLTLARAADLLGVSETTLRTLAERYASTADLNGDMIDAATLRHVVRTLYEAHG